VGDVGHVDDRFLESVFIYAYSSSVIWVSVLYVKDLSIKIDK
jgi:hypothetical protein